jgi:hypothetical protein
MKKIRLKKACFKGISAVSLYEVQGEHGETGSQIISRQINYL